MPISLIPPEVLARIFHLLVLEEPPCSRQQDLDWIRVTHVCHFWRQVALGDSSLWATISCIPTNTELISEMLAHARDAPLDIDIGAQRREVILMFLPHLHHTRKLRLYNLSMLHSDILQTIYDLEAPVLEHLELGVSASFPTFFQDLGGTTLFKGQAPRLQTLFLIQVLVPWSLIPRGQLTQLKIVLSNGVSPTVIPPAVESGDFNQLIDLLANCPGLETLVLEHCLPSQLAQFSHGQTIHLPRLSRLCLGGSSSCIMNLMKMLRVPSSTTLHLRCISENTLAHSDRLLLPVVLAKLQSPAPVEFQNLSITVTLNVYYSLKVTASTIVPSSRSPQPQDFGGDVDGDAEFVLSFDEVRLGNYSDLLERVCKMLPISNLEFLSISSFYIGDSVNWVELFKRCTKITAIQAIGGGTSSFVRALTIPEATNTKPNEKGKQKRRDDRDSTLAQPGRSTSSAADGPIFPKLTFLSLKRQDFSEGQHPSGNLFDVVERGLRQRVVAYNTPLEMLHIYNCFISAQHAEALQKLVQKFHWDQDEGFDGFDNFDDYVRYNPDTDELEVLMGAFF
jgi:hypothetical protein